MGLQTSAIDLDSSILEAFDQSLSGSGLVASAFDVVIIVVKLDLQFVGFDGGFGGFEGDGDVVGADGVVPDVRSPGAVVGEVARAAVAEGFVYDIPGVAAVAEVLDEVGDVVDQHSGQSLVCPGA